jgi:VanZ family protein
MNRSVKTSSSRTDNRPSLRPLLFVFWLGVTAWAALVIWLSSTPGGYFPRTELPAADKIVHMGLYLVGAFLTAGSLALTFRWSRKRTVAVSVLLISAFGLLDEIHQLSTPGRSGGDVGDWIADTAGAIGGVLLLCACQGWIKRRRPSGGLPDSASA